MSFLISWIKSIFSKKTRINPKAPEDQLFIDGVFLRSKLVKAWCARLSERETDGKNRSPYIDSICKFFGLSMGQPYCIGALLYETAQVLKDLDLKNPLPKTMSTQEFYNKTPNKYRKPKGMYPKKADICIQVSKSDSSRGHAYALTEDQTSKNQRTIEFNTDGSGGRDGDGAYERVRTQEGDTSKNYRGAVDVVQWILDHNKEK